MPTSSPRPMEISDTYGTWMNSAPLGETALASDGMSITLVDIPDPVSAIEDYGEPGRYFYIQTVEDSDDLYPKPYPGYEYFIVRVFVENISGDPDELVTVSHRDFGLVTASSGRVAH